MIFNSRNLIIYSVCALYFLKERQKFLNCKSMSTDEEKRTIWCGNLSSKVSEELLYELFVQAAPIERVKLIQSKNPNQASYGFVTLKYINSVPYTVKLLSGVSLFNRKVNIKPRDLNESVNIPPILPPLPHDHVFEKLLESGDKMLHFKEKDKRSPVDYERRNYHREDRYCGRHERVRNDRHPYRNHRHNQTYGNFNNQY